MINDAGTEMKICDMFEWFREEQGDPWPQALSQFNWWARE
jgi:hypothetical protein